MRAWVEVDLAALVANAETIARLSRCRLLPMVKANAYGLGAVPVVQALERMNPWGYGVATTAEGEELRRAGIARPILVFNPFQPWEAEEFVRLELRPCIGDRRGLDAWLASGERPFHVEVDTGMSRAGVRWDDAELLDSLSEGLRSAKGWEGVFTHFHSAETSPAAMATQWERFDAVLHRLPRRPPLVHAANGAAAVQGIAGAPACELVRPGIFLYGGGVGGPAPQPVARLRSRVIALRKVRQGETVSYGATWTAPADTCVATLGIGYADGIPRSLSNRGLVELGGRVVPLVGRVTMDMIMVAVPGEVEIGDIATLYGGLVSLDTQAELAGTISYELLTAIGPRVLRRYEGS